MTPEQIFDRLLERHPYLRLARDADTLRFGGPNATLSAIGYPENCEVVVVLYSTGISCRVYVGGAVHHPNGAFVLGRLGKMHATSEFATEDSIARHRLQRIGTAIPGWDLPGLRWRMSASAPMSSTAVPFLGRTDQYLVCESPITHMITERRTLAQYTAAEGDVSAIPQKENTK